MGDPRALEKLATALSTATMTMTDREALSRVLLKVEPTPRGERARGGRGWLTRAWYFDGTFPAPNSGWCTRAHATEMQEADGETDWRPTKAEFAFDLLASLLDPTDSEETFVLNPPEGWPRTKTEG